jgi:predicted component of type VI protein secretion system
MKWQLVVARGQRKGQVIPLMRIPFLIGRGVGCHLRPSAANVGVKHCLLVTRCGRLVVVDQQAGGTFVNGRRVVAEQELCPGDRLCVGPLEFRIGLAAEQAPPARRPLDEDAIGEMLLAMDEAENPSAGSHVPTPSASTATAEAPTARETKPDHQALGVPQAAPTCRGETARVASDLLSKYVRRPRVGGVTNP